MDTHASGGTGSWNMASLTAERRKEIEQHKAECLDRWKASQELANSIFSQLKVKGRMWAERELAKRPELEAEARAKLNRLMGKR